MPGPGGQTLFEIDRTALFDRWSGQMLTVDEQGVVVDPNVRSGWSSEVWGF